MRTRTCHKAIFSGMIVMLAAVGTVVAAENTAGAPPATIRDGETGVLLLQDGGVLEGQIMRAADWFVVGRGGGQMQVATSRVQFVGRSLHEAYEYRLRHTTQSTGEAHLTLAEWCLRYGLVDEAGRELETARSLGAGQWRLELIQRRLAATKRRPSTKPAAAAAVHSQAAVAEPSTLLSTASRDLPDGVLEAFTRKVQPILVNNCTAARCHQPGGQQSFQLNRALLRGEANRRTTTQNLAATLTLVNREHQAASPLLTVPRQTHGGMNGPIFGARQEQAFRHLADWVALVAPAKQAEPMASSGPTQAAAPASPERPIANTALQVDDANADDAAAMQHATAVESTSNESLRAPQRLRYGETPKPWQPRDPFDPEIFNRRQRAQSRR
jgi:hypothetical protein